MLDRKLYKIKSYPRGYKKKLKRINKTRERLNVANYIANVFNDLEDAYYDYLAYGDPSRDMYGQLIDKTSDEYLFDVDPDWLEYLGQTWALEDELAYCDKLYANRDIEYKMFDELQAECATTIFTQEEIKYYTDSFKKAFDTEQTDPIQRAMNAYQAVKDYEQAWRKYGSEGTVALYFGVTNEQEAQEWLEEFCKDIE
jgi:hypothetical protein